MTKDKRSGRRASGHKWTTGKRTLPWSLSQLFSPSLFIKFVRNQLKPPWNQCLNVWIYKNIDINISKNSDDIFEKATAGYGSLNWISFYLPEKVRVTSTVLKDTTVSQVHVSQRDKRKIIFLGSFWSWRHCWSLAWSWCAPAISEHRQLKMQRGYESIKNACHQ